MIGKWLTTSAAFALLGSNLLVASTATAAPSEMVWHKYNQIAVKQHVLPRYDALIDSTGKMAAEMSQFCEKPSAQRLVQARQGFVGAMDAWQRVQHIQFGPVTLLMRNFTLEYWPDKKNLGGRQVNSILNKEAATVFDEGYFASASVAVKGFPAIERVLYSDDLLKNAVDNPNYCGLLVGISQHVEKVSKSIRQEWSQEQQSMLAALEGGEDYESPSEFTTELMKALVEPVEVIRDNKLLRPLGKSKDKANWKRSESWRSGLSLSNMVANLDALQAFYSGMQPMNVSALLKEEGHDALAETIEQSFNQVRKQLASLQEPMDLVITPDTYYGLMTAREQLATLDGHLQKAMVLLDIQLGFNSRDGD